MRTHIKTIQLFEKPTLKFDGHLVYATFSCHVSFSYTRVVDNHADYVKNLKMFFSPILNLSITLCTMQFIKKKTISTSSIMMMLVTNVSCTSLLNSLKPNYTLPLFPLSK